MLRKPKLLSSRYCDVNRKDMALFTSTDTLDSTHGIAAGRDIYKKLSSYPFFCCPLSITMTLYTFNITVELGG